MHGQSLGSEGIIRTEFENLGAAFSEGKSAPCDSGKTQQENSNVP